MPDDVGGAGPRTAGSNGLDCVTRRELAHGGARGTGRETQWTAFASGQMRADRVTGQHIGLHRRRSDVSGDDVGYLGLAAAVIL